MNNQSLESTLSLPGRGVAFAGKAMITPNRDARLDFLRFWGMLSIMMAHAIPPGWLFQLRNFDVPLMIMISAILMGSQYSANDGGVSDFIKKRVERLIYPTWAFLLIFFGLIFLWSQFKGRAYPYSSREVFDTFLLTDGYVWIIRINLLMAILIPANYAISRLSSSILWPLLVIVLVVFEAAYFALPNLQIEWANYLLVYILYAAVPYSVIFIVGLKLRSMSMASVILLAIFSLLIFLSVAFFNHMHGLEISTQYYKYPARSYYIAYALFGSLALYLFVVSTRFIEFVPKWFMKLGEHSLWIYLWHILVLFIIEEAKQSGVQLFNNFIVRFVFILSLATMLMIFSKFIVGKVLKNIPEKSKLHRILAITFIK